VNIIKSTPVGISVGIMQFVSHPVADLFKHEIKTNEEYIQESIYSGYTFSSAYSQNLSK
jgi:hypothetical protein